MKLICKILIIISTISLFSSCKEKLSKSVSFFEDYDLNSGRYRLEVNQVEGQIIGDFKNFYIDDIATLIKMQKQWVFKYKSSVKSCGYGYSIALKENSKTIKQSFINIDCEYMSGWIYFPKEYLTDHKNHFKRIR